MCREQLAGRVVAIHHSSVHSLPPIYRPQTPGLRDSAGYSVFSRLGQLQQQSEVLRPERK